MVTTPTLLPPYNMTHDTIIARASAPGSAIRGILRISGQQAVFATKTIVEAPDVLVLAQRSGCIDTRIVLPPQLSTLPPFPAKLLLWKEGHSYTGDETVEIHTIGSPVLLDAIMTALLAASDDVRLAKPGEFTLRAFLSGRLDLPQAEAVLGVIDAADNADLKTALNQLAGNVSAPLSAVRTLLFDTLAQLEASLDFAEEDITIISEQELQRTLSEAFEQVDQIRQKITHRGIAEGKPKIVLAGPPNAGKSTLFNKLVRKDAALVSPLAGTTRDYLEAEIDWDGIPVVLIDTAGIDGETLDELSSSPRRQGTRELNSDLSCLDSRLRGNDIILDESAQIKTHELLKQADVIIYCHEETAGASGAAATLLSPAGCRLPPLFFQTKTANDPLESLIAAGESLSRAQALTDGSLIALEIRGAVNQLGLIDGTVHTEDILDSIFSRFCIGK